MRRLTTWTAAEIVGYHQNAGVVIFAESQSGRIAMAHQMIEKVLSNYEEAMIWEPGCGAGDVTGPYAVPHTVTGIEMVIDAVSLARERYPNMIVLESRAEDIAPEPFDLLVMTEFLEHLDDPVPFMDRWMPMAKYAVIGHPLDDPGGLEAGHAWSYDLDDFKDWFEKYGFTLVEYEMFSMGSFPKMVMGWGYR